MKKAIKLRDLTKEQLSNLCGKGCEKCPLHIVTTNAQIYCAYVIKDMNCVLSDEFLDQPIKIEVPDLLTEEEKSLLKQLVKLSAHRITGIEFDEEENDICVGFMVAGLLEDNEKFDFKKGLFKGVEMGKLYSLSYLGLEVK